MSGWEGDFFSIHLDSFGFTIDSQPLYLSLSWASVIVGVVLIVGLKTQKRRKKNK